MRQSRQKAYCNVKTYLEPMEVKLGGATSESHETTIRTILIPTR